MNNTKESDRTELKKLSSEKKTKKKYFVLALILVVILICLLIFCGLLVKKTVLQNHDMRELENKIEEMENRQVEVDSIREDVKQISKYSAYEFNYTSVMCFSDSNKFMGLNIPLTGNSFVATIDGKINIGINGELVEFSETTDSEGKVTQVTISVPHSEILDNYTSQDTLKIYDERSNIFNPVKITDYTDLLVKAESQEKEKVLQGDFLQKSDETIQYLLISHLQAVYGDHVKINYEYLDAEK